MEEICLGAYATEPEAQAALLERSEPHDELSIREDGDVATPWRVWWTRG